MCDRSEGGGIGLAGGMVECAARVTCVQCGQ